MIFVNGSTGFLGRNLIKALSSNSFMTFGHESNDYPCDLLTVSNVDLSSILDSAKTIVHIEAYGSQDSSDKHLESIEKTRKVIRCMNDNTKLVYISTTALYKSSSFADENDNIFPDTEYKASKAMCEALVRNRVENYLILRLCNVFGDGCRHGVIYDWKTSAEKNIQLMESYPGFVRHFMHIDDMSRLLARSVLCNISNETINLSGEDMSAVDLAKILSKNIKFGKLSPSISNIDNDKMRKIIGHTELFLDDSVLTYSGNKRSEVEDYPF